MTHRISGLRGWIGQNWQNLIMTAVLAGAAVLAFSALPGCADGPTMRESVLAARVVLVLEGDPTEEQIRSLVDSALIVAAERLDPEQLEAVRVLSEVVIELYLNDGDWRAALESLLEQIETGAIE